jgi:hypothetical protein
MKKSNFSIHVKGVGFIIAALLLAFNCRSYAACAWSDNTGTVASPYSVAEVASCVSGASSLTGEVIIQIPNSSVTWSSGLSVNMQSGFKNVTKLTIRGQNNCTVDADDRPTSCGTNITNAVFTITGSTFKKIAVEHLYLSGASSFQIYGNSVMPNGGWRIGHIRFNRVSGGGRPVSTYAKTYGVIHNCYFDRIGDGSIYVTERYIGTGALGGSYDYGISSLNAPSSLGTYNNVFIEDNTWYDTVTQVSHMMVDSVDGGRFVFRYNKSYDCWGGAHDLSSTSPVRSWETYNNNFYFTSAPDTGGAWGPRGGEGVIYNNYFESPDFYNNAYGFQCYRCESPQLGLGQCDNTPEKGCIGPGVTGENAYKLCTSDAQCGGVSGGCITIDTNLNGTGWPCRLQAGRGVNNSSTPVLTWNNTQKIGGGSVQYVAPNVYGTNAASTFVLNNRDYCHNNTTMPVSCNGVTTTYIPYTYPHPLRATGGITPSSAPSVPTGLHVLSTEE